MNPRIRTIIGTVFLSILLLAECDSPSDPIQYRTSGLKNVASLDVYVDGKTIHLLLAGSEADVKAPALRYTRSDDGGVTWRTPMPVATPHATPYPPHRGNDVQLAAAGDRLVAVWQTRGSGWGGSGPLAVAISSDAGKTWAPGPNPADDDSTEDHGFAEVVADGNGNFHLVWLDNRSGKQGLYYARSVDGGRHWSRNTSIDAATCECCWNTIKTSVRGELFALYRNIDPRDMALAGASDGEAWHRLGPVGDFDWRFDGCPHARGGLAIAADGERLHAVVWTGQEQSLGLHHLVSSDGGYHWSSPQRLGDASAHHADIAARSADHVAVVWDTVGQGHSIVAALSNDGGRTWEQQQLHQSRILSHPRVIATEFGWRVFWTESDGKTGVWAMTGL